MKVLRYFFGLLWIILLMLLIAFAMKNNGSVTLNFFLGYVWQGPLILLLALFMALGVVLGLLTRMNSFFRQRREILLLKRELSALAPAPRPGTEITAPPPADAAG